MLVVRVLESDQMAVLRHRRLHLLVRAQVRRGCVILRYDFLVKVRDTRRLWLVATI